MRQTLLVEFGLVSLFQWGEGFFDPDWHCLLLVGPMLVGQKWLKEVRHGLGLNWAPLEYMLFCLSQTAQARTHRL